MSIIVVGSYKVWDSWWRDKTVDTKDWQYNTRNQRLIVDGEYYFFFNINEGVDWLRGKSFNNAYFLDGDYTSELINAVLMRCRR